MREYPRQKNTEAVTGLASWVVIGYLIVGGLVAGCSAFFMGPRTWRMADRPIERASAFAWHHRQFKTGLVPRLRWLIGYRLLPLLPLIVAWPLGLILIIWAMRAKNHRQRMRALELAPANMYLTLGVLVFALLLLGMRFLDGPSWAIDLGCVFLLAGLTANLVSGAMSILDLPGQLRRNLMRPYVQFVVIAALQYLALLIGSLLLGPLQLAGRPTIDVVVDQLKGLGAFTNVFDAILTSPRNPTGILLTVTGVCLFALIGKVVFQYRKFVRLPADHAAVVTNLSVQGKIEDARRWLDNIDPKIHGDSALMLPRMMVLVGEGRYEKATVLAEAHAVLQTGDDDSENTRASSRDDVLGTLLTIANLMDLATWQNRQLVRFLVDRGISDGYLSVQALELCDFLDIDRVAEFTQMGISYETHPVLYAQAGWILAGDPEGEARARNMLAAATPRSATDRMARAVADYWISDVSDDDVRAPTEELMDLVEATGELPGWSWRVFARTMDIIATSQVPGSDFQTRARLCEAKLLAGIRKSELQEYESRRAADRIVWDNT
ncbi:hypothetical protein [Amycolatopsis lexingtonensis]|uniref:hypothetical protein n=1 Tax=Amycolatopsis lexingtonensis TaxID=218822 RepID=UPI003F6FCF13